MSITMDEFAEGWDARAPHHSKQSLRLWLRLLRCTTVVEKTIRNRLTREFNATLPRFDVLAALYRRPDGMTMGELSRHLLVSNGNVTGLVVRLQDDGFVRRQPLATDRRTFRVKLTAKGKRAFERMAKVHERWLDDMFGGLSNADIEQLLELLVRADQSIQRAAAKETKDDA